MILLFIIYSCTKMLENNQNTWTGQALEHAKDAKINWFFLVNTKAQEDVRFSYRKAEYEETCFVYSFFKNMCIKVKLIIVLRSDDLGAILVAENSISGLCTSHTDTRFHFVWGHIVDTFIKFIFVKLCNDEIRILPRNTPWTGFKHVSIEVGYGIRLDHKYSYS
jgi:hypothetical protein